MNATSPLRRIVTASLLVTLAGLAVVLAPALGLRAQQTNQVRLIVPVEVQKMLERMSGGGSQALALDLGIESIAGKRRGIGSQESPKPPKAGDVPIGTTALEENEPTVVANPTDKKYLVAGSHAYPLGGRIRCVAYTSSDGRAQGAADAREQL
jgi:hypothetical protein